jgi:hypothetical protein
MENLITNIEFADYRSVSKKINEGKTNEAISLAQSTDLNNILGDFYFDVYKNRNEESYADLMSGSQFTYQGEEFFHFGIKKLLADYAYARYVHEINSNLTPFGFQEKMTNDSKSVDRNTINDKSKQAQIDAGVKFRIIEKFIMSKPDLFSRFAKNKKSSTGFNGIRISKL